MLVHKVNILRNKKYSLGLPSGASKEQQQAKINELKKKWHPDYFLSQDLSSEELKYINDRFIWLINLKPRKSPIIVSEVPQPNIKEVRAKNRSTALILFGIIGLGMVLQFTRFQNSISANQSTITKTEKEMATQYTDFRKQSLATLKNKLRNNVETN
eukprot:NODE_674_length_4836_cov_1.077686.p4 type:complete len:157 gc:universal NODE_674_length_4836_cov_1.077686:3875-3405(-)